MKSAQESAFSADITQETSPVVLTSELRKVYRTGFWMNQKVVSLKSCSLKVYHEDLEPFMARGRQLRAEGKDRAQIFEIRENEARDGTLKMPEKGATLHILSGKEATYDVATDQLSNASYRYVVYLPFATEMSTGLALEPAFPGAPWIMDPGTHKAHIMISPPNPADLEP